jgi:mono/diheme cytochrome c family protein
MKLKNSLLLSAAVAALALAGCGNDGGEPAPPTPAPEATPEATPEPPPEPTPEPTPEATEVGFSEPTTKFLASLSDEDKAQTNPKSGDADAIKKGAEEYASMCKHCHGVAGAGDGPVATRFNPPASNLTDPMRAAAFTPGVNYQVMKQGIAGTAMQAFGAATSDETVWSILAYTETLVASSEAPADEAPATEAPAGE